MSEKKLTKKDFMSSQEVKWCPGCGDYAILSATQMAMAQLGLPKEKVVVVSGIGCSSRFPYYMNTYGMHTIHGRAPGFATGIKMQNPDLSVWVITGDGDGLSIGGNHLAHIIRRNVDVNIILFNNEIYGLTKGQYSPTSLQGITTKSTPYGSVDYPFFPSQFAMGAGSRFFARTIDTDPKHMIEVFKAAQNHRGTSFIEVLQNCVIFNDKVHDKFTNRTLRDDHTVRLAAGEKVVFGKDKDKSLKLSGLNIVETSIDDPQAIVYDPSDENLSLLFAQLSPVHNTPLPLGVIRQQEKTPYDAMVREQIQAVVEKEGKADIKDLLHSGETWEVK